MLGSEEHKVYVRKRPGLEHFMATVSQLYEAEGKDNLINIPTQTQKICLIVVEEKLVCAIMVQ